MIRHVGYKHGKQDDPHRRLLAAVVVQVVRDADLNKPRSPYQRSARDFLDDPEGQAWLRVFGIPEQKVQGFIENGYQPG